MRPDGIDGRHLVTRLVTLLSIRIRLPKLSRRFCPFWVMNDCDLALHAKLDAKQFDPYMVVPLCFLIMLGTRGDQDLQ